MTTSELVILQESSHHRSPCATIADLPNELIQEIIDHLSLTKPYKVASLSLISRSWFLYLRGTYIRFSRIHLHDQNVLQFLTLLRSPLCSFRSNVRQLYLDMMLTMKSLSKIIHEIMIDPAIVHHNQFHTEHSKPSQTKVGKYITRILTPGVTECHLLNIVCLFPHLEHLQVQLMSFDSNAIPKFPAQPPISSALNSITVFCNSSSPMCWRWRMGAYIPPEWKCFLRWIHLNKIYTIRQLYLTHMESWNYRAVEKFVKLQGTSLKHLHLGFGKLCLSGYQKRPKIDSKLDSLHIEVADPGMSVIVVDVLSAIIPDDITTIGLDIGPKLVCQAVEVRNLAEVFKTRRFARLGHIQVRMEHETSNSGFSEAVKLLDKAFSTDMLTVEGLPYQKRHLVRDPRDDCARHQVGGRANSTESFWPVSYLYSSSWRLSDGRKYALDRISCNLYPY